MTHWIPDTDPSCVIEINDRTGQKVRFVKASAVHASVADVDSENQRKNQIFADVKAALPVRADDGKEDPRLRWEIDTADRAVVITVVDGAISSGSRNTIRSDLQTKYGSDKVRLV
jgi:hypothetical protein